MHTTTAPTVVQRWMVTVMREKLIELVKQGYNKYFNPNWAVDFFAMIADHLIANGVTVQKWIPVKDELPVLHIDDYEEPDGSWMQVEISDFQWVFTATKYQTKARYESGPLFQGWVNERGSSVRNVTHWMLLPEPPKEDP